MNNENKDSLQSAADNLDLIRRMMEAGRRRAGIDGTHMIIWGALLMIGFFGQYASVVGYIPETIIAIWLPIIVIGNGLSFYIGRKHKAQCGNDTLSVEAYSSAWAAVGVGAIIYFGISLLTDAFDPKTMALLSSASFGGAFYVIARITRIKLLYLAVIGWWGVLIYFSMPMAFDHESLLIMAAASALLILLPGQLMRITRNNPLPKLEG